VRPTPTPTPSLLPLVQTANLSMKEKKRRMKQDPYGWAQAQQRKNANLKRREELETERKASWGDVVHGVTTPFVQSFDYAGQEAMAPEEVETTNTDLPTSPHIINHLLSKEELEKAIEYSRRVTQPLTREESSTVPDPVMEAQELAEHEKKHAKAVEALQRITDLKNGSAKDRQHANIRRCIETFGRHATDQTLEHPTKPPARGYVPEPTPVRAGPDTGSSEVQIAILTAKIRALALELEGPKGHRDKNNKRSLRLLCHKRQRLLRYMERKERGSGRWQYLVQTLGITPATYKDQISI
jgi:ribosomal protein S15